MGPSVSDNEQRKYQAMYVDFECQIGCRHITELNRFFNYRTWFKFSPGKHYCTVISSLQFIGHNILNSDVAKATVSNTAQSKWLLLHMVASGAFWG